MLKVGNSKERKQRYVQPGPQNLPGIPGLVSRYSLYLSQKDPLITGWAMGMLSQS